MANTPKHPMTSVTIVAAIVGIISVLKDRFGWDFSDSESERIITMIFEFGSLLVVIYGRFRAKQPVAFTSTPKAFLLLLPLLAGCATGTNLTADAVVTTNLGQSTARMDGETIAATGLDVPTVIWSDAGQHTKTSPFAETAMTLSLPNGMALHLTSPKDGAVESMKVKFGDTGQIASVEIAGIHYSASDVLIARGQELLPLVDYAKALSADERERFLAAVGAVNKALELAIKASLP